VSSQVIQRMLGREFVRDVSAGEPPFTTTVPMNPSAVISAATNLVVDCVHFWFPSPGFTFQANPGLSVRERVEATCSSRLCPTPAADHTLETAACRLFDVARGP